MILNGIDFFSWYWNFILLFEWYGLFGGLGIDIEIISRQLGSRWKQTFKQDRYHRARSENTTRRSPRALENAKMYNIRIFGNPGFFQTCGDKIWSISFQCLTPISREGRCPKFLPPSPRAHSMIAVDCVNRALMGEIAKITWEYVLCWMNLGRSKLDVPMGGNRTMTSWQLSDSRH